MKTLALLMILPHLAYAAEKIKPDDLTDQQLNKIAQSELNSAQAKGFIMPLDSPQASLVSTAEAAKLDESSIFAESELEVAAQSYQPVVGESLRNTSNYTMGRLPSNLMGLVSFRKWFFPETLRGSVSWRPGMAVQLGMSSSGTDLTTKTGTVDKNARFNTFIISVGPEAEWFFLPRLALGANGKFGILYSVQAATLRTMTKSDNIRFLGFGPSLRFQPTKSFFAKIGYDRRISLGEDLGLGVQENSIYGAIGFGM